MRDDWQQIQSRYLHTIGNLTLTRYNSELSDRPFAQKRDMPGGFRDSHLRLNADLAQLDHWDEEQIKRRAERLADLAVRIWAAPNLPVEVLAKYRQPAQSRRSSPALSSLADLQGMENLMELSRQNIPEGLAGARVGLNGDNDEDGE